MPVAAILCFEGCYTSIAGGFADVLQVANAHLRKFGTSGKGLYEWHFVSPVGGAVRSSNGITLTTERMDTLPAYDLIFVPSLHYPGGREFDRFLKSQTHTGAWIKHQWQMGAWVIANCTGTFVLAATSLLDQRLATTTWWLEEKFRQRFPLVDLQMRPLITEVDRLVCGGAHSSFLLQTIRVIERFSGVSIATQCARTMLIDVSQTTQTPFLPLLAERTHNDVLIQRAQAWLHEHMAESVKIGRLAQQLAVSERTLIRRFVAALDQSPLTYLQHLRIDRARAMLEAGDLSLEQIAGQIGYSDTSSFTRLFRERIGLTPGAYRRRFTTRTKPVG